jgi:hypothetical protein
VVLKVRATCVIGLALLCMVVACSFDDSSGPRCGGDKECSGDDRCYNGFCIPPEKASSSSPQTRSDGGVQTSRPGSGGKGGSSSSTGGQGGSSASGGNGSATPNDAGTGTLPRDAAVGGECNRENEERPCLVDPTDTISAETCNRGTQTCLDGAWSACAPQPMPVAETCNNLDDDCNGMADDLVETCFPDGEKGCTQDADGRWTCTGACGTGTRTCRDGALTLCDGATRPVEEACTEANMVARNEDCDDATDEGCECRSGETLSCWSGRADRMDVGKCKSGMQTCEGGAFGPCMGEVHEDIETCANPNVDDDCNGTVDDVPTVGNRCQVMGAQGPCATGTLRCSGASGPTCVSETMPSAEVCNSADDDCDSRADEGFNLRRDPQNCGRCGNRCEAGSTCCNSRCTNTTNDNNHCGACGTRCPDGTRCRNAMCMPTNMPMAGMPSGGAGTGGVSGSPAGGAGASGSPSTGGSGGAECTPACGQGLTCCGGRCVNLMTDKDNCSACGNVCPFADSGCCNGSCANLIDGKTCGACDVDCSLLLNDDGLTCMCLKDGSGDIGCRGSLLNLELCLL